MIGDFNLKWSTVIDKLLLVGLVCIKKIVAVMLILERNKSNAYEMCQVEQKTVIRGELAIKGHTARVYKGYALW